MLQTLVSEIEVPLAKRGDFWRALLASDVLDLLRAGETARARIKLGEIFAQT